MEPKGNRLARWIAVRMAGTDVFVKRADVVVTVNGRPLAKVRQSLDGEAEVLWNPAEVAALGVPERQVLENLELLLLSQPQGAS